MTNVNEFNEQSIGEEVANAISHGIGAMLAIAGAAVIIVLACIYSDTIAIVSSSIYGFSLIFLYLMSTLYHSFTNPKVKRVFQIFDHCSIFVLILGCYAPICLSWIGGVDGWILFGFNIGMAALGVTLNAVNLNRWHRFSLFLYLLMGWSVIVAARQVMSLLTAQSLIFLVGGGVCYTVGILFYLAKQPRFMHSIWHLFVLGGSVLHYFFILFYIILK